MSSNANAMSARAGISRVRGSLLAVGMVSPALLLVTVFVVFPALYAGFLSLFEWNGGDTKFWVGAGNYRRILSDGLFWRSLRNNAIVAVASVVFQVLFALVIAFGLTRVISRGRRVYTFLYLVPVVISEISIGLLWGFVYNPFFGLLNNLLGVLGLESLQQGWLGEPTTALAAVINVMNFTYLGLYVVLFVAAFQSIDDDVFEAAVLDGAGPWRTFTSVAVPMIRGNVRSVTILAIISSFKTFSLIFVLTRGGPNHASEVVSTYLYSTGFEHFELGYAATIGFTQLVLTGLMAMIAVGILASIRKGAQR